MSKKPTKDTKKIPKPQLSEKSSKSNKQYPSIKQLNPIIQQNPKQNTDQHQLLDSKEINLITDQQKQQALFRLHQLHQASQETQNKKTTLLLQSVLECIQNDIILSKVQISQQPQQINQFLHRKKHKQSQQKNIQPILSQSQILDKQYRNLLTKKQNILDQLRSIEFQQSLIRKNLHDSSLMTSSRQRLNKMPTLTEQNRKHWLKIKHIVKQHQENSRKTKQINQKKSLQEAKIQAELQEKRKQQKSLQKRQSIQKNIQEIKKRHHQRTQQIKESQALIQNLKKKTKLYQKMEQNWKNIENQLKSQNQASFFDNYQNKRLISVRQLRKYEQQHDIKIQQQEQKRSKRLKQSKISFPAQNFDKTKFSIDILEEAKKMKQLEEQKLQQIKQLINRKKEYATTLKQKYRSVSRLQKIKNDNSTDKKEQSVKQIESKGLKMRSMTALDIRNKGNQYMRSINSGLKVRSHFKKQLPKPQQPKQLYKNYLPQVLKRNTSKQAVQKRQSDPDLLHSIITKQKASTEQKFYQVQKITKKMEYGGTQKNLLNSINAKIQILKKLSMNNPVVGNSD